jgi:hypothetical protein
MLANILPREDANVVPQSENERFSCFFGIKLRNAGRLHSVFVGRPLFAAIPGAISVTTAARELASEAFPVMAPLANDPIVITMTRSRAVVRHKDRFFASLSTTMSAA